MGHRNLLATSFGVTIVPFKMKLNTKQNFEISTDDVIILISERFVHKHSTLKRSICVKSVQSALTYLLTTSGPHGMFSRLSTKRRCISIIELLQFTIARSFWANFDKALL